MYDTNLPEQSLNIDQCRNGHAIAIAVLSQAVADPSTHVSTAIPSIDRGRVALDPTALRALRHSRMLSQQDLADDCWRRNIRVSIATIKRAECGQAVRFRIVRELARCFEVPVERLLRESPLAL